MYLSRAAPSPLVAVEFDVHVRNKYAPKPYHLDDHNHLNFSFLTQILRPPLARDTNKQYKKLLVLMQEYGSPVGGGGHQNI